MGTVLKMQNKKGISWTAVYWCRVTNKRRWSRGHRTKKEAKTYVTKMENGDNIVEEERLFSDFCDYWIDNHAKVNCQHSTVETYISRINSHLKPFFKELKLSEIHPKHILSYFNYLRKNVVLTDQTVYHHYRLLQNIFRKALRWGYIKVNPAEKIDAPKIKEKHEHKIWEKRDLLKASEKLEGEGIEIPVLLGIYTGMRMGEILALKYSDIDFERNVIIVRHTLARINKKWTLKETKTQASKRKVYLPNALSTYLLKNKYNRGYCDNSFVCTRGDGNYLHPAFLRRRFYEFQNENGLPKIKFHELRHSHGTFLSSSSASLKAIQERLGHSSSKTTSDIYLHSTSSIQEPIIGLLEEELPLTRC